MPLRHVRSRSPRRRNIPALGFGPEANRSLPPGKKETVVKPKVSSPKKAPKHVITVRRLEKLETTGRAPGGPGQGG